MIRKIDLSKEKIRYVAIGDSISEGYNSKYNFGYAGKLKSNGVVTGISWPSYLVRFLKRIDKSLVQSYENFSLSGTKPSDWCYFLGIDNEKYNYQRSLPKIEFSKMLINDINNPERNRDKIQFGNFGKKDYSDFDYLKSSLEKANLVTLNIGANYLIPKIPINEIVSKIIDTKSISLRNTLRKIIRTVKPDVINLINQLKKVSPNSCICLVGYKTVEGPFWSIIEDMFKKLNVFPNAITFCFDGLNEALKECAEETNIDFISVDNREFAAENSYQIYNIFYDIHPTQNGYKKIAQDVLVKLSLPSSFFKSKKNIIKNLPTFNEPYIEKDYKAFKNRLDFSNTKYDADFIIKKIYGKDNSILFKNDDLDSLESFYKTPSKYVEYMLHSSNDSDKLLLISIKKALFLILNSSDKPSNSLIKEIDDLFKSNSLYEFEIKTKIISTLLSNLQLKIDEFYLNKKRNLTNEEFINLVVDQMLDSSFLVYSIKQASKFWLSLNRSKAARTKTLLLHLINELITKPKIKLMISFINNKIINFILNKKFNLNFSNSTIVDLTNFLSKNNDYNLFVNTLINFLFSNAKLLKDIKNMNDLKNILINDLSIIKYANVIFNKLSQQFEINSNLVLLSMNKFNIPNNSTTFRVMNNFLVSIFSLIKKWEFNSFNLMKIFFSSNDQKDSKNWLQMILNAFLERSDKKMWSKIKKIRISSLPKKDITNLIMGFETIFSFTQQKDFLISELFKLTSPTLVKSKKSNNVSWIKLIEYTEKLNKMKEPLKDIFKVLLSNFFMSKIKDKENIYYKAFFRLLLISIFVATRLFQTNNKKNVFMGNHHSIVKSFFTVAGYKGLKNNAIDYLILSMFNEEENYKLSFKTKSNKNRLLLNIYYFDKNENNEYNITNNKTKIFNCIKDGFID